MTKPKPCNLKTAADVVARLWWWADITIEVETESKAVQIQWQEAKKSWAREAGQVNP
jgi:hypothetical protein